MSVLPFERFDATYQAAVRAVEPYCTRDAQAKVALHCYGWSPGLFDFVGYLRASSTRFYRAYRALAGPPAARSVCDVGSFWGVFPVTIRALGFDVTMTESLQYYGDAFSGLFEMIRGTGVRLVDYDPFDPGRIPPEIRADAVTVMAVLEHYPHSLAPFMANVRALLRPGGRVYVEVPNLAYWPNRMKLLAGRTPLVPVGSIYRSRVPFVGHHHEFTMEELRELADLAGLRIVDEQYFSYSVSESLPRRLFRDPIGTVVQACLPDARETLAVLCEPAAGPAR